MIIIEQKKNALYNFNNIVGISFTGGDNHWVIMGQPLTGPCVQLGEYGSADRCQEILLEITETYARCAANVFVNSDDFHYQMPSKQHQGTQFPDDRSQENKIHDYILKAKRHEEK